MAADYPGSVKSFSTKTDDTDVIEAAHMNDVQNEVSAIETELGTDPAGSYTDVDERLDQAERNIFTTSINAISANSYRFFRIPNGGDSVFIPSDNDVVCSSYVSGTNNGSNFWTITIAITDYVWADDTVIHTFSTAADAAGSWINHSDAPDANTPSSSDGIQISVTKTGSPGALDLSIGFAFKIVP